MVKPINATLHCVGVVSDSFDDIFHACCVDVASWYSWWESFISSFVKTTGEDLAGAVTEAQASFHNLCSTIQGVGTNLGQCVDTTLRYIGIVVLVIVGLMTLGVLGVFGMEYRHMATHFKNHKAAHDCGNAKCNPGAPPIITVKGEEDNPIVVD